MKKINLVVPLAGKAQRFLDAGFKTPKPLIMAGNKMIIDRTMECIDYSECNLIFVVRSEHITNFSIDEILRKKFGSDVSIVVAYKDTSGSVESVCLAKDHIDNDLPLVVYCSDVWFETSSLNKKFRPQDWVAKKVDGMLLTFKSNSPNYSYVELNPDGTVKRTAEKTVISNQANCGVYYFCSGKEFLVTSQRMITLGDSTKGEYFIAPLYNHFIKAGNKVVVEEVNKMHIFGTPQELDFYVSCVLNEFDTNSVVALCSDHSGFDLKEESKSILDRLGVKYIDYGCYSNKPSDYVDYACIAGQSLQKKLSTHVFAFCRTANGQNMVGNKVKGVRATLISDEYTTQMAVEHNCSNWFSIPSKYVNAELLEGMIRKMLSSKFEGGRHQVRVQKVWEL